jgi:hypothetical protein
MVLSRKISFLCLLTGLSVASCKKKVDPPPTPPSGYTVPTTYNFSNVSYSGQTTRLSMLTEIVNLMKTGNTSGTFVDATVLKNMFSNTGSPFADTTLNTSGKQLKSKCFAPDQPLYEAYMDSLSIASQSSVAAAPGVAGVSVSTTDATKKYLLSANGIEYTQLIDKGLMGAVFYYQAINVYICADGVGSAVDNNTVITGEGTAMEHHWDEGFGYFGAPIDFPANLTGLIYWAKYSNSVNANLSMNTPLMDAFLKGRAAISNKDYTTRDQQITIVRQKWELLCAAAAIYEINRAIANFSDNALRCHYLSEGVAFINNLKYNGWKTISDTDIATALSEIGDNFYTVTLTGMNNAKNLISTVYNLDAVKDLL